MKKQLAFMAASAVIVFVSCTKSGSDKTQTNDPIIPDSSHLVKSLQAIAYDNVSGSGPATDSSIEYFYYDSPARKIIVSLLPVTSPNASYDGVELNFNNSNQLTGSTAKNTSGALTPDIQAISYTYDNAKVISQASVTRTDGNNYTISFQKTSTTDGGYDLRWFDPAGKIENPAADSLFYTAHFNLSNQWITVATGNATSFSSKDSSIYYTGARIKTVFRITYLKDGGGADSTSTRTVYDFKMRETNGNQFDSLGMALNAGLPELPASVMISFSQLAIGVDEYAYQYRHTAALQTEVGVYDSSNGTYSAVTFNGITAYDGQQRLLNILTFFNDYKLTSVAYRLEYYK